MCPRQHKLATDNLISIDCQHIFKLKVWVSIWHYYVNYIVSHFFFCSVKHVCRTCFCYMGGGPRVVVSTAALHARVRGSVPGLGGLKETKMFLPHPRVKVSIAGSLRDREVACSASDRQGSNFKSCVWRTVSSQSSHHPQEVLLAQFSLYVHKGGLKPDSFHFCFCYLVENYLLYPMMQPSEEVSSSSKSMLYVTFRHKRSFKSHCITIKTL